MNPFQKIVTIGIRVREMVVNMENVNIRQSLSMEIADTEIPIDVRDGNVMRKWVDG